MKRITLSLILALFATPAFATTYYVSAASGNDSNSCPTVAANPIDQTKEKKTINGGVVCMSGGDTLQVRAGNYNESIYNIVPNGTGFPSGATTMMAFPGDSPTLVGNWFQYNGLNIIWNGININGVNLIQNGFPADQGHPIFLQSGQHMLIENAEIYNGPCNNILTDDAGGTALNDITFDHIHSDHAGINSPGSFPPGGHDFYISAHNFNIGTLGITIDHSEMDHAQGGSNSWGVQIYATAPPGTFVHHVTVRNSFIHDNSQGIVVGSGGDHLIYNNIVANIASVGAGSTGPEPGINVGYNTTNNVQVYNNTIYNTNAGSYCIGQDFGTVTNTIVQNNLCYANGSGNVIQPTIGDGSGTFLPNYAGAVANPNFTNGSGTLDLASDFTLQGSSPAPPVGGGNSSNSGAIFTTDYLGFTRTNPWTDGAYQFAATGLPVLTTVAVTNIAQTTATSGGNISSDGGSSVTAKGVAWSLVANPTTADSHTNDGTGTGLYSSAITGLTANTTYNYRAYAINANGTAYGSNSTFTTLPLTNVTSIRSSSTGTNDGTAACTASPSGLASGDILLGFFNTNSMISIADNNGSTPMTLDLGPTSPNPTSQTMEVWSRRIQPGDPSNWCFTLSLSNRWTLDLVAIANPNATSIYDVAPSSGNTSNSGGASVTTCTAPSVSTVNDSAVAFMASGNDGPSNAFTSTPSGWGVQQNGGNQGLAVVAKTITSHGATGTGVFSFTSASECEALTFAIANQAAAPIPPVTAGTPSGTRVRLRIGR